MWGAAVSSSTRHSLSVGDPTGHVSEPGPIGHLQLVRRIRHGDPGRRLRRLARELYLLVNQRHAAAHLLQLQRDGPGPVGPLWRGSPDDGSSLMTSKAPGTVKDGAHCQVIGGTHAGKSGIVRDIKTSKSGHITITVVQANGERFKTLAKNVVIKTGTA